MSKSKETGNHKADKPAVKAVTWDVIVGTGSEQPKKLVVTAEKVATSGVSATFYDADGGMLFHAPAIRYIHRRGPENIVCDIDVQGPPERPHNFLRILVTSMHPVTPHMSIADRVRDVVWECVSEEGPADA